MKIIGTGSVLPEKVVTNDMLAEFLDTSDEWIRTRTGVISRHVRRTPILLDECNRKGLFKKGDLIAMSAFGAGFVSGALLFEW